MSFGQPLLRPSRAQGLPVSTTFWEGGCRASVSTSSKGTPASVRPPWPFSSCSRATEPVKRVEATSPGIGLGSEFVLRVPILARADLGREPSSPLASAGQPSSPSRRVLIIEDNEDSRETLQLFLEGCGHHVDAAEDGVTGVARAIELKPDILLVDIGLPGMDGYGVARHVREVLGQSVYLVALTGYGQPEDRRLAIEAGFDVHFTKPVRIEVVEQLLSRADLRHPPN